MIETLMGKETFARGLDLYHRSTATEMQPVPSGCRQWKRCPASSLRSMAEGWLKQTGFPTLSVKTAYDSARKVMTLHLRQEGRRNTGSSRSGQRSWMQAGIDLAEVLHRVEKTEETLEIPSPDPPAFISLNRGYSFYGKVRYDAPPEDLYLQAEQDSDTVNRCLAFMAIMDREKLRMLADPSARPGPGMPRPLVPAPLRPGPDDGRGRAVHHRL